MIDLTGEEHCKDVEIYLGMDAEIKCALVGVSLLAVLEWVCAEENFKPCFDVKAILNMLVIFDNEEVVI